MSEEPGYSFDNPGAVETCQVTGKVVPSDEIVEFQGYRVCAEGKAELLRRLRTGQAMPGEMATCSIGARIVAMIVDGIIFAVVAGVGGVIIGISAVKQAEMGMNPESSIEFFRLQGWMNLVTYTFSIIYYFYMHGSRGQTIGKMAARIMVVDMKGENISYKTAMTRALYYQGLVWLSAFPYLLMEDTETMMIVYVVAVAVMGLWGLTDTILALTDRAEQRSLHDRLAGTRVIYKP